MKLENTQSISNKKPTRECSIETCIKKTYCKGLCRNHYNSLIRHGDPLQAERNIEERSLRAKENREERAKKPKLESNLGKICGADGCDRPARIKGYCIKHDARIKRNGTLELKIRQSKIKVEECLIMGCTAKPKNHGICANHLNNIKDLKTPLKPKVIKMCGVKGCDKPHMAKGMCSSHYAQWKAVVRDHKLSKYLELSGWEDDGKWKL